LQGDKTKVLLIDIETAPMLVYAWGIWEQNIGLEMIVQDWHLLSFAAKWLGEKEMIYEDQAERRDMTDDSQMLKHIHRLLDEADIVIAQNGDGFDLPKIRARMIQKGLPPPSPIRTVDTLKVAKKEFGFTSNKLLYLSSALGCKVRKDNHVEFPGFELWKECLARNKRAWKVMRRYNIDDVLSLEDVYLKMRPFIPNHPNLGVNSKGVVCPKCGGEVHSRGYALTQANRYQRFQCQKCGGWSRRKAGLLNKSERQNQLSN